MSEKKPSISSREIMSVDVEIIYRLGTHVRVTEWIGTFEMPIEPREDQWPEKVMLGDREYVPAREVDDTISADHEDCYACMHRFEKYWDFPCSSCRSKSHWKPKSKTLTG